MRQIFEVESKHAVDDLPTLLAQLKGVGGTIEAPISQTDTYYNHPQCDFAKTDEALRIRSIGAENLVTYKGPKIGSQVKTREEIELPLASGAAYADQYGLLLEKLRFRRVASVRKVRTPFHVRWEGSDFRGAIDQVEQVGLFVELELSVREAEIEQAEATLISLTHKLKLGASERRSYLEMLLEIEGKTSPKLTSVD